MLGGAVALGNPFYPGPAGDKEDHAVECRAGGRLTPPFFNL